MMVRQLDRIVLSMALDAIGAAYDAEFGWVKAHRINPDVKLLLLAVQRLRNRLGEHWGEGDKGLLSHRTALVLGSQLGCMASYEAFDNGMRRKTPSPIAFTYALPSTAAAAVSIHFGIHGPLLTMSGGAEVGLAALRNAVRLLESRRCDMAIAGCLFVPSETSARAGLPSVAQVLLLAIERVAAGKRPATDDMPVHVLSDPPVANDSVTVLDNALSKSEPA